MNAGERRVQLWTRDEELADVIGSVAAASGVPLVRVGSSAEARGLLLVGEDVAAREPVGVPTAVDVVLVGEDGAGLAAASLRWGARVVALPEGRAGLRAVIQGESAVAGTHTIAVVGAAGGVGTSTVATGIARGLAARRLGVAIVDADADGGGLDLLWGAEGAPGWRWSSLAGAEGEVGDLRSLLPSVEGVTVVSHGRTGGVPGPAAMSAVLRSLQRTHDVVVVDAGRGVASLAMLGEVQRVVVVTSWRVGSLAACARLADALRAAWRGRLGLVVVGSGGDGPAESSALDVPHLATLPRDAAVARAAEHGVLPDVAAGRRWRAAIKDLAAKVAP